MTILFLITAKPNAACGVGDYTQKLVGALRAQGTEAQIECLPDWSWASFRYLKAKYGADKNITLHLEYPTLGMGKSMFPALLPIVFSRIFLTLHEFSIFSFTRKMLFLSHSLFAKKIMLTSDFEQKAFLKIFPWASSRTVIVPVGNNISVDTIPPSSDTHPMRLAYFGQITENKGIDFFIETVRILRSQNAPIDAAVIGSIIDEKSQIADFVRNASTQHGIELRLNLTSSHVSHELQRPTIALLAFPDGITDKRGSALACLGHGNAVITVHTEKTPEWLRLVTYHAASSCEAAHIVMELVHGIKALQPNTEILETEMEAREWNKIAFLHIGLYKD